MIRALLFDFDGVVVDTEVGRYESWRELYREHGVDLDLSDWLPVVGSGSSLGASFDAVAHLEALAGIALDRDAAIARRTRRRTELCDLAPLRPGVSELLAEARRAGLATGVVTRAWPEWVEHHLARVGLAHEWNLVVCAPSPEAAKAPLYRDALARLDITADEAIAFEDSPSGLAEARRAGIRCVAVPNDVTRGAGFDGAALVVHSLEEWPLEKLLARLVPGAAASRAPAPQ